ncbi:MAG: protein translocase subunit SecF [Candidatus Neomarinimicrobiota bacterium]|nr:MAG: protein translocase subunit SecF [Candidatus Neomarinimicrobiota bacterium]
MLQFFKNPNYDITGKRKIAFTISIVIIIAGIVSLIFQGLNYGVDFAGGAKMQIAFKESISAEDLRSLFTEKDLGNPEIKSSGTDEYMITINANEAENSDDLIKEALTGVDYTILQIDKVGPKMGHEMRNNSYKAVGIALLLILIYITVRFEFKFAIGAVVALLHDILITLAFFSFFQWEFSLPVLAAFLTIVGYSLNDTIVVYDRIRENIKIHKGKPLLEVINLSINQSLSRTIITSLTTFVVVLILAIFGGQVLFGFSIAIVVGVIVGTYSSMFVAAPILIAWEHRFKEEKGKNKKR